MNRRVVVAGASGVVGSAVLEAFLDDGWDVVALSRRVPEIRSARPYRHLSVDLQDKAATSAALGSIGDVTHLAFAALYEMPGLIGGWSDTRQMDTNLAMLQHCVEPLTGDASPLQHVTIMQGTKAYGVHLHAMDLPARETAPRDPHANFYWLQEDYLRARAEGADFAYTVMRPPMIMGGAIGAAMNLAPVLGAYAAICREEGRTFAFPGGAPYLTEALDARVLAKAFVWAAQSPQARNEIFNISNGDVFEWRSVWEAIADTLGVEVGDDTPMSLAEFLPTKSDTWDRTVAKHGLRKLGLKEFLGESHFIADFCLLAGVTETPRPGLMSTIKIHKAGFNEVCDTEDMFRYWLGDLINRQLLPPRPPKAA
jgi:nucleoside-diphosphate-sugar epimerase